MYIQLKVAAERRDPHSHTVHTQPAQTLYNTNSLASSEITFYALHTQYVYYRSTYFWVNK